MLVLPAVLKWILHHHLVPIPHIIEVYAAKYFVWLVTIRSHFCFLICLVVVFFSSPWMPIWQSHGRLAELDVRIVTVHSHHAHATRPSHSSHHHGIHHSVST